MNVLIQLNICNWACLKITFLLSGNKYLHQLTSGGSCQLRIDMVDWSNHAAYAKYSEFSVGDEASGFELIVGGYSGTAGRIVIAFWIIFGIIFLKIMLSTYILIGISSSYQIQFWWIICPIGNKVLRSIKIDF